MSYIRKSEYAQERVRPNISTHYLGNMEVYLKARFPTASEEEITSFIKKTVMERFTSPTVEALVHKREGYSEHVETPLHSYIQNVVGQNNLSPSGSCYKPVSEQESFLRQSIEGKIKERNAFKKKYLAYEAQGMKRESQYFNQNQANAKIFNNAIAGGMRIKQFILGSLAGFNAITSVGRMCVKQGYSFIERAVNGNIYLPSTRDAITYSINHVRNIPNDFAELVFNNSLYIPTSQEVTTYLINSVKNYVATPQEHELFVLIDSFTPVQRSYVFYAGSICNLCRFNESMMRDWIDSCFLPDNLDKSLYQDISLDDIKKFPDDVLACMLSTNYKRLGENPEKPGKFNSPKDAAKFNPEGLKEFIYACNHFVTTFEKMIHIIRPLMRIETTFSRLMSQEKMARYTVPLSDTDSNIFSTQELIRWKRNGIDFSQESYNMNAIVTFILSQSLEHVFARLSSGFGIEGKDVFRISMKNEFLYPIMMITSLGKHYLAIATMQEGSLLPNPRKDIKGVGFRSSAYPKVIRDGFEKFVVDLFKEIEKGKPIRAAKILSHISAIEHEINESILNKEATFLQTASIKRREDYADPDTSVYFYYEFWQEVFAPSFGEMVIPNKCFKIPLKGKKLFKDPQFLEKIEKTHPDIHRRLLAFMEKNPKKDINAVMLPPFKGNADPFFVDIMDIRSHISQVMSGYYLVLDALGIGTVDKKANTLVSDFYNPEKMEI